ncbi:hypothetical protein GUJ93_ZPchr0003g16839 [Zizania palustris]|nr:hypothetical protein GUJ93_ZPchr0003g16839 [Zizania palustris]
MTFGEVVKEVDKYFGKDLFEKKPLIRSLIEEELFRLAEEAEKKELEEEEAAEAKARAEVATKGMTQDGVNSGIDKAEELQVDKDVKSEDAAKIEDGNRVEQVLKAWISVDDESRNRIDAAESSQDGQCEHDRRNENNGGDFTRDDNAQDINRGDHVECSRDCDRLKKNNNSEAMGGSEDGKSDEANTGENDVTKDGINRNGGKSALDDVCGAEPTLDGENGENATCLEEGKAEETGNVENSENTASHDAKDGKGKEAMENANTEQSITGANDDGKTEYAEHTVNTKADVDLPADDATENGKTEDQIATSKQSEMAQLTDMHAAHAGN